MIDRVASGSLHVSQQTKLKQVSLEKTYDLVIAALSWEQRATSGLAVTTNLSGQFILLRFASSSPEIDKAKDVSYAQFKSVRESEVLQLSRSTEFAANAIKIESFLKDRMVERGRPLKILIDITCVPKSYLLFLIGLGFSRSYFSRFDCIYSEGAYTLADITREPPFGNLARGIISDGQWDSLQIPYLGAETAIPRSRDLLVAMGGEIGLSLPFIEKYEPTKLGLVLIRESLVQTPEKLIPSERAAITELLSEPNVRRLDTGLCDVTSLVKDATEFCVQSSSDSVTGLALGAKPHALALGIVALDRNNLEIVCRVPQRYHPLDVAPTGEIAFYELEDRFEPTAYI